MTIELSKVAFVLTLIGLEYLSITYYVLTLIGLEYLSITYYVDVSLSVMCLFRLSIINIREIQRDS